MRPARRGASECGDRVSGLRPDLDSGGFLQTTGAAAGVGLLVRCRAHIAGGIASFWRRAGFRSGAVAIAALSFFLAACNPLSGTECETGTEPFVEYQLFMGRGGAAGEVVSDEDWDEFLAAAVTPRFPDGLTAIDGFGQWRDSAGQIRRERTKILVLYAVGDESSLRTDIDAISSEYERRFDQESVLRVVDQACVSFS